MNASLSSLDELIDVREIAPPQRHERIFSAFTALPVGGALELRSDHEPLPLKQQFQAQWPGQFDWQLLQGGPDVWRVRIGRKPAGKTCCGCCGG